MCPRLLHIYGPLWINSYGVMIAVGLLVWLLCTINHPTRKKYFTVEEYFNTVFVGLFAGVAGGRLLYVLTHMHEFTGNWISVLYFWEPGLFILGAFITIMAVAGIYLAKRRIPILPVFDMAAVYAPLFQAVARFGCLFAGCCYGAYAPNIWYAVTFTNPDGSAPVGIPLHPTQIYTSVLALLTFLVLYLLEKHLSRKPGALAMLFLAMENASRFIVDFWRADREFFAVGYEPFTTLFSQAQVLALLGFALSFLAFIWLNNTSTSRKK